MRPYQQPGLTLAVGNANDPLLVRALQRDLRALGYLLRGIDGDFGGLTERAIKALQLDLMHNSGAGRDGRAPIPMTVFNQDKQGRRIVTAANGVLDQPLATCIDALLSDSRVVVLPFAEDPVADNASAMSQISSIASTTAPAPFIAAIVRQESGGAHYQVPRGASEDNFVTTGLDRNDPNEPERVTSRGYGIGQYTLFHHPPTAEEQIEFIVDPIRNVQHAFQELREKFDRFVVGPADRADDRTAEHPLLPMRLCKFVPSDPRHMRDCKTCAAAVSKRDIVRGMPVHDGASLTYQPTQYYASASYSRVPVRAEFPCDWPYATRRYNGSGTNSYHYQTKILLNLLR